MEEAACRDECLRATDPPCLSVNHRTDMTCHLNQKRWGEDTSAEIVEATYTNYHFYCRKNTTSGQCTHLSLDSMAAKLQPINLRVISSMKIGQFRYFSVTICSLPIFLHENELEKGVWKMAIILSRPQFVEWISWLYGWLPVTIGLDIGLTPNRRQAII